jgi:hypothetical protein
MSLDQGRHDASEPIRGNNSYEQIWIAVKSDKNEIKAIQAVVSSFAYRA